MPQKTSKEEEKTSFFKKKKKWIIVLVILLAIIFVWKFIANKKQSENIEEATIKKGTIREELVLSGKIVADEHAQLKFKTAGEIAYVGVKEGDEVRKGALLTKLDTSNLNSDFERAKADLRDKEATVDKVHDDLKDAGSSETLTERETRTNAEVAKDKAYEAYLKAEKDLKGASLFAPFTGIVTFVQNPFSGINVLSTQIQVEIVNPKTIYFEVTADQTEVTKLSEGQEVSIVLDSFLEKEFPAIIKSISLTPKTDEAGAVYKIRVLFNDPTLDNVQFRIGMTGDAKFILKKKENALFIPTGFLNSDEDGKYVNLGRKNKKVYVETGLENEDEMEIIGDVKEGEKVYD